ncbi:uncharacterized protein G2W53_016840 [Senna tora]|uniref:Uncharacterized protein n=1 Tax=Senna tora TaxID=362788 RepID=A0A834TRM6_9FABA|nr:uncharacterized protein G2W53_016840 [Senna tora]
MSTPLKKNELESSIEGQKVSGLVIGEVVDYRSKDLHLKLHDDFKEKISVSKVKDKMIESIVENSETTSVVVPMSSHNSTVSKEQPALQFSFTERLQNWNVQFRIRQSSKRFDAVIYKYKIIFIYFNIVEILYSWSGRKAREIVSICE